MTDLKAIVNQVKQEPRPAVPVASAVLRDGSLVEMVYDPEQGATQLVRQAGEAWRYEGRIAQEGSADLVPFSPANNLLKSGVILFPSAAEDYGAEADLLREIRAFIHHYVDVGPLFAEIATYYVLFTWVYDAFRELPYLRVLGDAGSGKTRFLLTVGSLCYKPIFASGASTVSPLFRILDLFRGTLIVDEGDFRFSDERAEVVKILNNGNARGFPVLRSEAIGNTKEYSPHAYQVFGPKLVATRGLFQDKALESRCLTEEMGQRRLRDGIPINLDQTHEAEALRLRNKLLTFRFRTVGKRRADPALVDPTLEPRLNQVFVPLLSIIEDTDARARLRHLIRAYQRELVAERGLESEAHLLEVLHAIAQETAEPPLRDITRRFIEDFAEQYERKITEKWVGWLLRRRLGLRSERRRRGFVVPRREMERLPRLLQKYGLGGSGMPDGPVITGQEI